MIFRLWVPMLRLSPWQQAGWGTCRANSPSWGCLDAPHPRDPLCSKASLEQQVTKIMFGLGYAHSSFHSVLQEVKISMPPGQPGWQCRYPQDRSGDDKVLRSSHPWALRWGHQGVWHDAAGSPLPSVQLSESHPGQLQSTKKAHLILAGSLRSILTPHPIPQYIHYSS